MPKLRGAAFAARIIERRRGREPSAEGAMAGMCLAGVSTRGTEDAGEVPWGPSVPEGTASGPNRKAFAAAEAWRTRPLDRACPYACVDGTHPKKSWGGACDSVAALIAMGVSTD